ncbi:rhomboid family protein [Petrotoga mexicana DSM 14811]|uniref:Rhomboid family protein n=3 Tax=Petrotoga TaxID=28236 RepID=A0A2K1PDA9_9BACT|nr:MULTISPECIES: rhomboid family intramembrane serine protease [Petrotoga]PNR99691.1 rhomboid family protein [Petrotoga miotherma DSM 10691]PNS00805.1 rhomboid family protein [Petrotoga mexicana DSM 14811]POZ93519.1 Rhomboid family protein [Petrotoga halophila DSM 16923]
MQRNVTSYLIMLNVLIFIMMFLFGGISAFSNPRIYILFGAQLGNLITAGEWFRLITSMFVHGGLFHIFFNMIALFYVGNLVERAYGKERFISIYMLSGIFGNLLTHLFLPSAISVGASGAIFGLIGLLFGAGFRHDTPTILRPVTGTALLPIILINVIWGFLPGANINNFAHLGGLGIGFTFGWLTPIRYTKRSYQTWRTLSYLSYGLIIASFILLLIFDFRYYIF